jgi:hypothetical protein
MSEQKFDMWCVIELFGHQVITGRVTERTIGGGALIQVDVPETTKNKPFTKLFHQNAIYAITPVAEEYARQMAESIQAPPLNVYNHSEVIKRLAEKYLEDKGLAPGQTEEEEMP